MWRVIYLLFYFEISLCAAPFRAAGIFWFKFKVTINLLLNFQFIMFHILEILNWKSKCTPECFLCILLRIPTIRSSGFNFITFLSGLSLYYPSKSRILFFLQSYNLNPLSRMPYSPQSQPNSSAYTGTASAGIIIVSYMLLSETCDLPPVKMKLNFFYPKLELKPISQLFESTSFVPGKLNSTV